MHRFLLGSLALLSLAAAQQVGKEQSETHPKMTWQKCSGTGSCSRVNGEVVIDSNWRWVHEVGGYENCYDGNTWTDVCSSADDCAKNCAVEGADYQKTYGVSTSGDALTLRFATEHEYGTNVGSRLYLMASATKYQMFTLMNNEFAFDVDLSTVDCGMNSALYFVPMKEDGGLSSEPNNKAGAKYGVGYCDAQCARDLKFIGGKGNIENWEASDTDDAAGVGGMGSCCAEIDVWESNAHSYALTPHACANNNNYHICETDGCGGTYSDDRFAGNCDANGCDYNPFRLGNTDFYGKGKTVDTTKKFTWVKFPTAQTRTTL
jgi:cellulose 1,4-beta-cellobiosidase